MSTFQFENEIITQQQADAIVNILVRQGDFIAERENNNRKEYPSLYDADYMKGRTHGYTASVLSGFKENIPLPDMLVRKIKYGIIHCQPQIESEKAVIQLYSSEASLNTKEIREKCRQYNMIGSKKEYGIIQFHINKHGNITSVYLLKLDVEANIILKEKIYQKDALKIRDIA